MTVANDRDHGIVKHISGYPKRGRWSTTPGSNHGIASNFTNSQSHSFFHDQDYGWQLNHISMPLQGPACTLVEYAGKTQLSLRVAWEMI